MVAAAGERKLIFRDNVTIWAPLAFIIICCFSLWWGVLFTVDFSFELANILTFLTFFVLVVFVVPLQGRVFWTTEIKWLEVSGAGFEGRTIQWIGFGRRVRFKASDAKWRGENAPYPRLFVEVGKKEYEIAFKTAKFIDREAFAQIAPEALAAADAPKLQEAKAA